MIKGKKRVTRKHFSDLIKAGLVEGNIQANVMNS